MEIEMYHSAVLSVKLGKNLTHKNRGIICQILKSSTDLANYIPIFVSNYYE